jgi:hypothetical protein
LGHCGDRMVVESITTIYAISANHQ